MSAAGFQLVALVLTTVYTIASLLATAFSALLLYNT